jgi:hypothetical protein
VIDDQGALIMTVDPIWLDDDGKKGE